VGERLVKYDLTRKSIASFAELSRTFNEEGAVRASVVSETPKNAEALKITDGEYVAVKAPTLDGTELWLVSRAKQEAFELSMGFEKASVPLMNFEASRLDGLEVLRDPDEDETFFIRVESN
jgi:hypothetical protein